MNDSGIGDLAPARSGAAASPLEAQHVGFDYSGQIVLRDLSLRLPAQRLTALVGPNGSGKSTLMSTMARLHAPSAGRIVLDGRDIGSYPTKEVARRMAILPQTPIVPEAITVFDLVSRGRYPHQTTFRCWTEADTAAVERAMEMTNTLDFSTRPVDSLSGGQRQRCWIAMALAQQTEIILLDEPTSALDLHFQLEILDLLHRLTREHRQTVAIVLHDLNLASSHADHMVFLAGGRIVAEGPTVEVCTAETIETVFGVPVHVLPHPETGRPVFTPRGVRS